MGGIREQIALALRQQLETGDHNLSETVTYEPLNNAVQTGVIALFRRGQADPQPVMGVDYQEFEATILIYADDLIYPPQRGDRVRTATEVWHIDGIHSELPGAYLLRATRKILQPAVAEA